MEKLVREYIEYLKKNKNLSDNTLQSCRKDVEQYAKYSKNKNFNITKKTSQEIIIKYLKNLKDDDKRDATISRKLASIRSFYQYLLANNIIKEDPTKCLESPKIQKRVPEILNQKEIENLLKQPECTNKKGIRDKAMLELLCATGVRVSELMSLNVKDINWKEKTINCKSSLSSRKLKISKNILEYLDNYIKKSRCSNSREQALFVNIYGKRLTRQGFWKIIKFYKNKARIDKDVTPHTLRHSLAVNLIKQGTDQKKIKEILGYKDISSTNIYKNL